MQRKGATNYKQFLALTSMSAFSKIVSVLFKIVIIYIIGTVGIGYYQLAFPLFVFSYTLSSVGNSTALTMFVAEDPNIRQGKPIKYAILLSLIFSAVLSLIIVFLSKSISKLQGNASLYIIYLGVASTIISVSLLSTLRGAVRGYKLVKEYAISDCLEQIAKLVFSVTLSWILLPLGLIYAVLGVFFGITLSAVFSLLYTVVALNHFEKSLETSVAVFNKRQFWVFAVLSCITSLILPFTQFIDSTLIVRLLESVGFSHLSATKLFGLSRGTVSSLLNLPNSLILAIEVLLLPDLIKLKDENFLVRAREIISIVVIIGTMFSFAFFLFSKEILTLVYGAKLDESELTQAITLLKIGSFGVFFAGLSQIQSTILQGKKMLYLPIISLIVASITKIVFEIIFIPKLGIIGVELSGGLFYIVLSLLNSIFMLIKKIKFGSVINLYGIFAGVLLVLALKIMYSLYLLKFNSIFSIILSVLTLVTIVGSLYLLALKLIEVKNRKIISKS